MDEELQADVVIVGAGIAGTMAGLRLAQAGATVLILDAGPRVDRNTALKTFRGADSRITPTFDQLDALGLPRPRLQYSVGQYTRDGMAHARAIHDQIFDALGVTSREHREEPEGAGHVMGTYRMGLSPATSVVDPDLRAHDHDNLFLLGGGVFPTCGTANPTLTIAALALRAAETIRASLAP